MAETHGVIGAGLMGAEIAFVHAMAGDQVLLLDRDPSRLEEAVKRLERLVEKGALRGLMEPEQGRGALDRISPVLSLDAFSDASIVTEAVFEDEAVKKEVFQTLDGILPTGALIATNTSTIPISTLASALSEERRPFFVGTHYFSPVSRMKLVEVIAGFDTSEETTKRAMELCQRAGKDPVRVKDVPGFAVNRMLHVFLIEAVKLVEEGVATPEDIDRACRLGLGHPIGPFALMDAVTSDLCVEAELIMEEAYGERFRPPPLLKQRVRAGYGGGKGRKGWL